MRIIFRFMFLALLFLSTTAFAKDYTIGVFQGPGASGEKASDMRAFWNKLTPYLSQNTGDQFAVKYYTNFDDYVEALHDGKVDFAYSQFCGSPAAMIRKIPNVKVLTTVLTKNMNGELKPTFHVYLITAQKGLNIADANDIQKLNGKTIAMGTKKDQGWGRIFFSKNKVHYTEKPITTYTEGITSVLNGQSDATLTPDRPIKRLTQAQSSQLQIVPIFQLTNGAMFARPGVGPIADKVQTALLKVPASFFVDQLAQGFGAPLTKAEYIKWQ